MISILYNPYKNVCVISDLFTISPALISLGVIGVGSNFDEMKGVYFYVSSSIKTFNVRFHFFF